MSIDECIDFLGYRIDRIVQPLLDVNVPAVNGIMGTNKGIQLNRNRLCRMNLPDTELKKVKRVWKVGIYDDNNSHGVSVFEGNTLLDALLKAVDYIKK
ncbi:hypothetical protein AALB39_27470 [Lachnospiraceae bacterium 54-53]